MGDLYGMVSEIGFTVPYYRRTIHIHHIQDLWKAVALPSPGNLRPRLVVFLYVGIIHVILWKYNYD